MKLRHCYIHSLFAWCIDDAVAGCRLGGRGGRRPNRAAFDPNFVVRRRRSMYVLVDDGVVLGVDDDVVADRGGYGHGGTDGRQRVVRGGGTVLLLVVVAGRGHEHRCGRRVTATAGLVRQHAIAFVRAGTAGTRAERPSASRLIVRVEQVRIDVVVAAAAHVHVRRHCVRMIMMMMVMVMMLAVRAVHQRLRRFL